MAYKKGDMISQQMLSTFLGVRASTLQTWREQYSIPHDRRGNKIYYDPQIAIPFILKSAYMLSSSKEAKAKDTQISEFEYRSERAKMLLHEAKVAREYGQYVDASVLERALNQLAKILGSDLKTLSTRILARKDEELEHVLKEECVFIRENFADQMSTMNLDAEDDDEQEEYVKEVLNEKRK